jgi:hypothetical protein
VLITTSVFFHQLLMRQSDQSLLSIMQASCWLRESRCYLWLGRLLRTVPTTSRSSSMMFPLLRWNSERSSWKLLIRNRSLSKRPREPSTWYKRQCKIRIQLSLRLREKLVRLSCWDLRWANLRHTFSLRELRLQERSQDISLTAEARYISMLRPSCLTWLIHLIRT